MRTSRNTIGTMLRPAATIGLVFSLCSSHVDARPQCAADVTISPSRFSGAGGVGSARITTSVDCSWKLGSRASWMHVRGSSAGTGSGTVVFDVAPSTSSVERRGKLSLTVRHGRRLLATILQDGRSPSTTTTLATTTTTVTTSSTTTTTLFPTTRLRGRDGVFVKSAYDYGPTVMFDGVYKMWWCGGVAGDYVLYAEATDLGGPWHARGSTTPNSYDIALTPTGRDDDFDGLHVCDPSVVRVNGQYYLYYTGGPRNPTQVAGGIGVATSNDGVHFTRLSNRPIFALSASHSWPGPLHNTYGAGQPSVTYVRGRYYVTFTDTTSWAFNTEGKAQRVVRAADPTFQQEAEELGPGGFGPPAVIDFAGNPRFGGTYGLLNGFSVDWQFVDALDAFMVASNGPDASATLLYFFDRDLQPLPWEPIRVPGVWQEGPGLVSRPDKHALPPFTPDCGILPVDILRSVGSTANDIYTGDIGWTGVDLLIGRTCEQVRLDRVYEGSLVSAPGTPLTLVTGGRRLQFALIAPATRLAHNHFPVTAAMFHQIPFGGSLHAGAATPVIYTAGQPGAFLMQDATGQQVKWPVSCADVVADNGSPYVAVTPEVYASYPVGPSLYCLR